MNKPTWSTGYNPKRVTHVRLPKITTRDLNKLQQTKIDLTLHNTALYYCVDDLPGASIPGARLQKILNHLQLDRPINQSSLDFLQQQSLLTLHRLITCELHYNSFRELALAEQIIRIEEKKITQEATRQVLEAEECARDVVMRESLKLVSEKAEAARWARVSDPNYLARIQNKELLAKYGINYFVKQSCFSRLMSILKRVDAGQRLDEQGFVWLSSVGVDYFSAPLRTAYHRMEADFYANEYERAHDPWNAVNASSHYRKCNYAHKADALLSTINIENQKSPKLKSAFYTTHGGVMRDMERRDEALRFGEKAHALQPNNFQPCTLLGATHMDIGSYPLGKEWYDKAVERGATVDSVDKELRTIFARAAPDKKREMGDFLLSVDPFRYDWVQKGKTHSQHATRTRNFPRQI
jgi:tetratricopeptide (TPR) repeat protein